MHGGSPAVDVRSAVGLCPWCSDEPALHRVSHTLCARCLRRLMREAATVGALLVLIVGAWAVVP